MELSNTFTVGQPIDVTWPVLCDIERIAPCMPGAQLTEVDGEVFSGEVKLKVGPINARFKGTAEMVERDDDAHRAVLKAKGKDTGGKGNANATITATAEPDGDGTRVTIATDLSITGKVAQFGRGALDDISTKLLGQFVDCLETNVLAGDAAGADGADEEDATSPPTDGSTEGGDATDGEPAGADGSTPQPAPATAGAGSPVATAPAPPPGGMPAGSAATGGEAAAGTPGASAATSASAASGSSAAAASSASAGPRKIDGPEAEPIDLLDATGGADAAKKAAGPVAAVMALFFVIWWWRRRG